MDIDMDVINKYKIMLGILGIRIRKILWIRIEKWWDYIFELE